MNNTKEERVTDLSIIMEMIDSKPYYSVQYRNVGEIGCHIGYSSYNLKTVLEFIGEYFEIVENDKQTNADRIRSMSDEELADIIFNDSCIAIMKLEECPHTNDHRADMHNVCKECIFDWLQSEAE